MPFLDLHVATLPAPVTFAPGAPKWRFELSTLDGTALGDITDVRDRVITYQLVKPQTIAFTMDLAHPRMDELMYNQHVLIKVYRENVLQMVAETTALQVVADGSTRSVRVVATEAPWVKLQKRLIGKSLIGVTFTSLDRASIAGLILDTVNAEAASGTVLGSIGLANSVATAGPWHYKPALEAIQDLAGPVNGFDFWFTPVEPAGGTVARFHTAPTRGAYRANVKFEYGTGVANARSYEWQVTVGDRISRAYSLPGEYPNNIGLPVVSTVDAATELVIGRREVVTEDDIDETTFKQMLTDEEVRVRKNPKNVFLIQPAYNDGTGRVPSFPTDYNIGDLVEGRVLDQGTLMLDAFVRVYGAQVSLSDEGAEEVTLALVEEAA